MKFKNLLKTINTLNENAGEHTNGGGLFIGDPQGKVGQSPLLDKGTFNLGMARNIDAINAMLYTFSNRDYIDPDSILGFVKQKLNMFGLDFSVPANRLPDGMSSFDLVQYGSPQLGVYGQNPYDDVNKKGFKQGDGIKEKLGYSLALTVNVVKQPNYLRKVILTIVPSQSSQYNSDNVTSAPNDCGCQH